MTRDSYKLNLIAFMADKIICMPINQKETKKNEANWNILLFYTIFMAIFEYICVSCNYSTFIKTYSYSKPYAYTRTV